MFGQNTKKPGPTVAGLGHSITITPFGRVHFTAMNSDLLILFVLVSLDDRFQNFLPTISAVNITRAQQDAFTIPELIEAEQRMETGTAEIAVVG